MEKIQPVIWDCFETFQPWPFNLPTQAAITSLTLTACSSRKIPIICWVVMCMIMSLNSILDNLAKIKESLSQKTQACIDVEGPLKEETKPINQLHLHFSPVTFLQ